MAGAKKKVMDVAKPGDAEPQIGSKPMVVGHKTLPADPDVATKEEQSEEKIEAPSEQKSPSQKKMTLQPLSEQLKPDDDTKEKEEAKTEASEHKAAIDKPADAETEKTEPSPEEAKPKEEKSDESTEVEGGDKKKKDQGDIQLEREKKLQELIKSKKYFVPVNESSGSSTKTFILTFIVTAIIACLVVAVLIDAEILDIGVELPFDYL